MFCPPPLLELPCEAERCWACLESYFCERLLHSCRDWLGVNYDQLEQGPLLEHTPQASFRKTDC